MSEVLDRGWWGDLPLPGVKDVFIAMDSYKDGHFEFEVCVRTAGKLTHSQNRRIGDVLREASQEQILAIVSVLNAFVRATEFTVNVDIGFYSDRESE